MPLALADMGVPMMIQRVGGNPAMRQHLSDLGFVPGSEVTVISTLGGNMIVSVMQNCNQQRDGHEDHGLMHIRRFCGAPGVRRTAEEGLGPTGAIQ